MKIALFQIKIRVVARGRYNLNRFKYLILWFDSAKAIAKNFYKMKMLRVYRKKS